MSVTPAHRHRTHTGMAERSAYPSDLSDARWALIAPRLTAWRQTRTDAGVGGRTPTHDLREIFNAILYINRTGIPWRYLPHDFPPYRTVYGYFAAWTKEGIFVELNYDLTGLVRDHTGKQATPTASIMDTQSVKTSTNVPLSTQGTDAGKKVVGRKRGIITDTLGLPASSPNGTGRADTVSGSRSCRPWRSSSGRRCAARTSIVRAGADRQPVTTRYRQPANAANRAVAANAAISSSLTRPAGRTSNTQISLPVTTSTSGT
ncbi:hypothetical protein GCM10010170_042110 [Dactylosporangium salmoneum]|uniref:Insertion element IS402-like domain-containing protein n=1 Tax=Dactylosporangium salmoneum TaxID=53361 RepID=A0ABP5TJP7_9ACTN